MEKKYFDYAIGINTKAERRLLVAPGGTYLSVNDTVETLKDTYCLLYLATFYSEDDRAIEAVKIALNQQEPECIIRRIISENINWDVKSDDEDA